MHRAHHAEIDREEHADRDQRDLRGLENAEPQDEQRHPGDRRDRAQRLQGRIEQAADQRRIAGDRAERACRPRRRSRSRRRRAAASRATWRCSSPVCASSANVAKITEGGGTRRPSDKPEPHRDFPDDRQRRPAAPGRAAAATSAPARSRVRRCAVPAWLVRRCVMDTKRHTNTRCKASSASIRNVVTGQRALHRRCSDRLRGAPGTATSQRQFVSAHASVVDQVVDRRLHVDVGLDHAGLLQREAGRQDRLALRRADLAEWVSSVRSLSCLSTTASGSLVAAMKTCFSSS